jgi:CRISPR/Cas system-associated protein Cas10 (large subunit of type III CRISPR-Cas system)
MKLCEYCGATMPNDKNKICKMCRTQFHKKSKYCDGCGKDRNDVKSCGHDSNGDPDAPDLCFICRKEAERGKFFNRETNRYQYPALYDDID